MRRPRSCRNSGSSARDEAERLPEDLCRAAECYRALRMVSSVVMEELELPTSDDPMRLPEELYHILHRSRAIAK